MFLAYQLHRVFFRHGFDFVYNKLYREESDATLEMTSQQFHPATIAFGQNLLNQLFTGEKKQQAGEVVLEVGGGPASLLFAVILIHLLPRL